MSVRVLRITRQRDWSGIGRQNRGNRTRIETRGIQVVTMGRRRGPGIDGYTGRMQMRTAGRVSLTAILGTPLTDAQGHLRGKLKDVAVATGADAGKVAGLVFKSREGLSIVASQEVMETPAGTLELRSTGALAPLKEESSFLFLQQDLVDRQIIDINGRKVVRVNDVDLEWISQGETRLLRVVEVEVGLRGAFRRVFKGLLPRTTLESVSRRFKYRGIPWHFVDVIEVDPARRVRLRIEHERLADMHPSDLAEILEDLAPAEREAVFTSLDEEVAAETLEEVDPKLQKSLLEKLDDERIADIVEEMDPGAAADLLAELSEEQSDAILEEMEPEERQEVSELLEFDERSAAGAMTTDFVHVSVDATVAAAVQALRNFDGDPETRDGDLSARREEGAARVDSAGAAGDGAARYTAGGAGGAAGAVVSGRFASERAGRDVRQVQPARAAGGGLAEPHGGRGAGGPCDCVFARKAIDHPGDQDLSALPHEQRIVRGGPYLRGSHGIRQGTRGRERDEGTGFRDRGDGLGSRKWLDGYLRSDVPFAAITRILPAHTEWEFRSGLAHCIVETPT